MRIAPGDIEVLDMALSVMRGDKADDVFRQIGFFGHFNAVCDVFLDNLDRFLNGELIVRIGAHLVLRKVKRVLQLADIVVQGSRTDELRLGSDGLGGCCRQIGHLKGMLECAGSLLRHPQQQSLSQIAKLHQRDSRHEAENTLKRVDNQIGHHQQDGIQQHHADGEQRHGLKRSLVGQSVGTIDQRIGDGGDEAHAQELSAVVHAVVQAEDNHNADYTLHDKILEMRGCNKRTEQSHDHVAPIGRPRAVEGGQDDCRDAYRDQIDGPDSQVGSQRSQDNHQRDHADRDQRIGLLVMMPLAEQVQESELAAQDDGYQQYLSDAHQGSALRVGQVLQLCPFVRIEFVLELRIHYLTLVDNPGLGHDDPIRGRNPLAEFVVLARHRQGVTRQGRAHIVLQIIHLPISVGVDICHQGVENLLLAAQTVYALLDEQMRTGGNANLYESLFLHLVLLRVGKNAPFVVSGQNAPQMPIGLCPQHCLLAFQTLQIVGHFGGILHIDGCNQPMEAILHLLYDGVGMIDGEVEVGRQPAITPRHSELVLVSESIVMREDVVD